MWSTKGWNKMLWLVRENQNLYRVLYAIAWSLDFILGATGSYVRYLNTKVSYADLHFKKVTPIILLRMAWTELKSKRKQVIAVGQE